MKQSIKKSDKTDRRAPFSKMKFILNFFGEIKRKHSFILNNYMIRIRQLVSALTSSLSIYDKKSRTTHFSDQLKTRITSRPTNSP